MWKCPSSAVDNVAGKKINIRRHATGVVQIGTLVTRSVIGRDQQLHIIVIVLDALETVVQDHVFFVAGQHTRIENNLRGTAGIDEREKFVVTTAAVRAGAGDCEIIDRCRTRQRGVSCVDCSCGERAAERGINTGKSARDVDCTAGVDGVATGRRIDKVAGIAGVRGACEGARQGFPGARGRFRKGQQTASRAVCGRQRERCICTQRVPCPCLGVVAVVDRAAGGRRDDAG